MELEGKYYYKKSYTYKENTRAKRKKGKMLCNVNKKKCITKKLYTYLSYTLEVLQ